MANEKLSYQQLEDQLAELQKQNEILRRNATIQEKEGKSDFFYNKILNNVGDPIFVKDDQSRILLVNDAFCKIFGLEKDSIIGKTLAEHVAPEERENFLKIDKQVIVDGVENLNEETLTVREGETRFISTKKTRFIGSDGKKYLVGVIRDTTDRKHSEDAIKESTRQLKAINATKDKLFSIIAHDLRSPFNNIIGLSELLIQNINTLEDSEKFIKLLNSSAKSTLILLENLLNWAKSQSGQITFQPEKISSSNFILETIAQGNLQAKSKNITLNYIASEHIDIYADVNMLKIVMRNLISNAIKFTPDGGNIIVSKSVKKDQLEITISDDGIGMNKDKSMGLFNIHSNTSTRGTANENGSGLGLVLCKEFVRKNGGEIWVESSPGKGSHFKFTLPLCIS